MLLEQLRQFVDEVKSSSFAAVDVPEARLLLDELELTWLEALGEADVRGLGSDRGARSTAAWLAMPTTMRHGEASVRVKFARNLRSMPVTMRVVREGSVSLSQARILSRGVTPSTRAAFAESEEMLVRNAAGLNARQTECLMMWWLRAADPDGTEQRNLDGEDGRRLAVRETLPGEWWIDGRCTPIQAEVVNRSVDALVSGWLRDSGDTRTVSQMRIDALVEICRQWLTHGDTPMVRDERPHVNLNVDLDSLASGAAAGWLENGNAVPGDVTAEIMCDCVVTRIMSRGSLVLDVGRAERLVSLSQRKAVAARDRGCRFPDCGRSPSQCDAHHLIEWVNGGRTDLSNLVLLCRFHHRLIHKHRLRAELDTDATFRVWDSNGTEMRSVPPLLGALTRRSTPTNQRSHESIPGLTDAEMRQRVCDAIVRFQTAIRPPSPRDIAESRLIRQRISALTPA